MFVVKKTYKKSCKPHMWGLYCYADTTNVVVQ